MISFEQAHQRVLGHSQDFGKEAIPLKDAIGRTLAADILADRDFPPFDRATKDGIAIRFEAFEKGRRDYEIAGIQQAGNTAGLLEEASSCYEIMTGALIPYDADTVVMYEHLEVDHGIARIKSDPLKGQNIHLRGSDKKKGAVLLKRNTRLAPADIGVLASVGAAQVEVLKLPRMAIISTGDELVEVDQLPLPHQIRKSNSYQLNAALREEGICPMMLHVADDVDMIRQKLTHVFEGVDVLLLSGGVSRGKFDFIPQVLEELGVEKVFHKVRQKPGKPFWFGIRRATNTLVFSFPGNPVSTYVCYYRYFKDWLTASLGLPLEQISVILGETLWNKGDLTAFVGAKTYWEKGYLKAVVTEGNGSGDLTSLAAVDGFLCLAPSEAAYAPGDLVPFVPTRKLI
jgi:molybdopterin molybdotransferase